ncbi:hypothetical protein CDO44_23020 [Pigmentiphaga sp. NML080357]|uniref:tripartite tricarboxylate transporter TctB family protein n=1 Tax=Pigmentiphaga sp. NML080357 TaxID=2008675 RepID=UPI000B41E38C|nr:tripartite tricarboxylate transporter TctB family protein [Pigmentiphaga sp. NML080357]OVZ55612.1 hypothetical protein CDO44_23020 [Pigmentiphaga sp. NML080357]
MNDRLLGTAALAFAAVMAWQGYGLEAPFAYEPVGPRAFPMLLSLIIGLCGLWLAVKGGNPVEPAAPGVKGRVFAVAAALAVYAFLFQWLGVVFATFLMSLPVGRAFGGSWFKSGAAGLVLGVAVFLLFDKVLDVVLPTGLLGGLL